LSTGVYSEQPDVWAVEAHGLGKWFGHVAALHNVTFQIPCRQFVAILGHNGAGKTTLLRILATLTRPSTGTVRIAGLELGEADPEIRRRIGVALHHTLLYNDLTAIENLRFYARLWALPDAEARINELLDQVGLAERRNSLLRILSRGLQQRLSIARALLHRPQVILLDEPFSGLDPTAADEIAGLLSHLRTEGSTVLLSTHDISRGAELADRVLILSAGRVARDLDAATTSLGADLPAIYRQCVGRHP